MPSLDQTYQAAFSKLPVDEAVKAVEAAVRYQGLRGYQRDLASGANAAQAFAKWGPMLFRQATGIPEALDITKPVAPQLRVAGGGLYRVPEKGPAETLVAPTPKPPVRPPASVELVDEIQKANQAIRDAESKGDKEGADKARERSELLQSQAKGGINMEFGPGGTLQSFSTGGGQAKPTIAMATQAQEKLVKYKNSMDLMNSLEDVIKPEHLGVRGVAGEVLIDKGLQQAAEALGMPDVAKSDRMESRKLMVALREGLMREMNDGSRFSLADREEISKALPSSGIWESGKDAEKGLSIVRKVLTQRSQNYARSIGKPIPLWTLSGPEIKQQYPNAQDIVNAVKARKLDKEDARNALVRYY